MSATGWAPGTFAPAPGAAPALAMLRAQTAQELRLTLRRGESLLLVLVIPVVLLLLLAGLPLVDLGPGATDRAGRADVLVPGLLALAVMSTAFTGQAIATGYERAYGVLKRLGATPLSRPLLLAAKTLAVLAVLALQVLVLGAVGLAVGWSPQPGGAPAAVLLLVLGGVVFPLSAFPDGLAAVLALSPLAALAEGLRAALGGAGLAAGPLLVLTGWAVASLALAARTFRWE